MDMIQLNGMVISSTLGLVRPIGGKDWYTTIGAKPSDLTEEGELIAGRYEEAPAEEVEAEKRAREAKRAYDAAVDAKIRTRYSLSEELAVLRQRDTKPDEFAEYNAFAEACKAEARNDASLSANDASFGANDASGEEVNHEAS